MQATLTSEFHEDNEEFSGAEKSEVTENTREKTKHLQLSPFFPRLFCATTGRSHDLR